MLFSLRPWRLWRGANALAFFGELREPAASLHSHVGQDFAIEGIPRLSSHDQLAIGDAVLASSRAERAESTSGDTGASLHGGPECIAIRAIAASCAD